MSAVRKPVSLASRNPELAISVSEACDYIAEKHYSGRRAPSRARIYAWMRVGLYGVQLGHTRVGRTVVTTARKIDAFFAALKPEAGHGERPARRRKRTHRDAVASLVAAGC